MKENYRGSNWEKETSLARGGGGQIKPLCTPRKILESKSKHNWNLNAIMSTWHIELWSKCKLIDRETTLFSNMYHRCCMHSMTVSKALLDM